MRCTILAVGDVVSAAGLQYLKRQLPLLRDKYQPTLTVVNGENAADVGLSPRQADTMLDAGADVITLGNHTFRQRSIVDYLDACPQILRPANFAPQLPGRGYGMFDSPAGPVAVVNLIGRCNMAYGPDNPFLLIEKILPKLETKLILVDFHAEATSEKLAMGYLLDGRISALWGTHTHVPTADAQILPDGTGYLTDLGMTGPRRSVIGIEPQLSIQSFRCDLSSRYKAASGPCILSGAVFTVDTVTGHCTAVEPVTVKED